MRLFEARRQCRGRPQIETCEMKWLTSSNRLVCERRSERSRKMDVFLWTVFFSFKIQWFCVGQRGFEISLNFSEPRSTCLKTPMTTCSRVRGACDEAGEDRWNARGRPWRANVFWLICCVAVCAFWCDFLATCAIHGVQSRLVVSILGSILTNSIMNLSCSCWRQWCRKIEFIVSFHQGRVLRRDQVYDWCRIRCKER